MIGVIVIAVVVVVVLPVALMLSGGVAAAVLGWVLNDDAARRYEGSELLDLNK